MPLSIRADWRANQQIALSGGVADSGLFQLNFEDPRYLPFEHTGAVSTWLFELPRATNPLDFSTLTDVVIHLRYEARSDPGEFRRKVMALDAWKNYRGSRVFRLGQDFPSEWQAFKSDPTGTRPFALALPPQTFPSNVRVDPSRHELRLTGLFAITTAGLLTDVVPLLAVAPLPTGPGFLLTPRAGLPARDLVDLLAVLVYTGEVAG